MTARAIVRDDLLRRGVTVVLGRLLPDGAVSIQRPNGMVEYASGAMVDEGEPTLRIDEDMARALLDALAEHFGGTAEVQTLRKDYLAERARVDLLIKHLTTSSVPR